MKKSFRFILALTAAATMLTGSFTGCGKETNNPSDSASTGGETQSTEANNSSGTKKIREYTGFFAVPRNEITDDNACQQAITDLIGAKCKETWLTGQTAEEAIGVMVAGGEYPDFVDASTGYDIMLDAGAFIPIDKYWDKYPNIKNFYSEAEWNSIRADDGHVYIIPQYGNVNGVDMQTIHNDEAFWIQVRVLKWAGYPKITTLDEYFKVIEDYIAANPTSKDGTANIGYEILCDDWRYFCLENPPMFLDGSPNDGCCIVDPTTHKAIDYNTTETAKRYFKKLNEEFKKGIIDPETFTMNYDQYISKLSSGRVLGMVDQFWNFTSADVALKQQKLYDCTYVPVGVTIDKGIKEHYHNAPVLDVSNGVGITTSCKDVEGALQFINDLLEPEVLKIRFWGLEGKDYLVDENGVFYRTQEMRDNMDNQTYRDKNICNYAYFPYYEGKATFDDKNAWAAEDQPGEFYEALPAEVKECFEAYGVKTYVELLNPSEENAPWFPMWSFSNTFNTQTDYGTAKVNMDTVKHEYLPKVILADDFNAAWDDYMSVYNKNCDIPCYLKALDDEIQRRIDVANGK
jgi:putative aldouronate transport system substrate-binding protein